MSKNYLSALLACLLLTGSAVASPTVTVNRTSGYYSGSGGEFALTPNSDYTLVTGGAGPFESFCVETNQTVTMGTTYGVAINTQVAPGGAILDPRTAYLYSHFLSGTLTGYNYTSGTGRSTSAGALQDVIWYLENTAGKTWTTGSLQDTFYTAAANAVNSGSWTGVGNVRILNLYDVGHIGDPSYGHQDMLATVVPAPGTLVLACLGTGLVGWLRRRRAL